MDRFLFPQSISEASPAPARRSRAGDLAIMESAVDRKLRSDLKAGAWHSAAWRGCGCGSENNPRPFPKRDSELMERSTTP
jgi:hypothetical protein